ncbi:hypothetical protein TWF751_001339 [Orbilia oligospora]|nr:hypothetical protein TWF751_001339 [Orbilia oligospora]
MIGGILRLTNIAIQFAIANYPSPDTQPEERSSNGASLHLKSHTLFNLLPNEALAGHAGVVYCSRQNLNLG